LKHSFATAGIAMIVIVLLLILDNYMMHPGFTIAAFIGMGIFVIFGTFLVLGDFLHKLD
jgi:hypothetical protein